MAFEKVASVEDLWSGEMRALQVRGQRVLLVNHDGRICAYADACPHQQSRLSEGSLKGNILRCATHHWEFNVSSGSGVNPQNTCLRAFAVALNGADILVDVDVVATPDGVPQR